MYDWQWNGQRGLALDRDWFGPRYMQAEEDAKLLDLAGEVALVVGKQGKYSVFRNR